jgi:hypothetical protein
LDLRKLPASTEPEPFFIHSQYMDTEEMTAE